jgi:hypothetical protein
MTLAPGARVGPYEILVAPGAGGMWKVWGARAIFSAWDSGSVAGDRGMTSPIACIL